MTATTKRIGILTAGGDSPGLNAALRGFGKAAIGNGWELIGFRDGIRGLVENRFVELDSKALSGILTVGGTILGTSRDKVHKMSINDEVVDARPQVVANVEADNLDALVLLGGGGTQKNAMRLAESGLNVLTLPKTIDNDIARTDTSFGFATAMEIATEAIDRLHSTAKSHDRVMVVEVMGRNAGFIALNSGISGNADVILIPEIPFDIEKVCDKLMENELNGRKYAIVVVAEGAVPKGGDVVIKGEAVDGRQHVVLGGIAEHVAKEISKRTGKDSRSLVLGHLQRGGSPTTFDRLLSLRFGAAAVRAIEEGKFDQMVALKSPDIALVPLAEALGIQKRVRPDGDTVLTARDLGICFGD